MSAIISNCGRYRYRLERQCEGEGATVIIMVNPSTADATENDATIRKLIGFGNRHKWGRLIVGNLFAYRATDVKDLARADDPVGPENDAELGRICQEADRIVFAWGPLEKQPKYLRGRWRQVAAIAAWGCRAAPLCIGDPVSDGHPRHPLMPAYTSPIREWNAP